MSDSTGKEQDQGDLAQQILDRIVTDEGFRQQLLNNPAETLAQAGYWSGDDVSGYKMHVFAPILTPPQIEPPPQPFTTTGMDCGGGGGGQPTTTAIACGDPPPPGPGPIARQKKPTIS